MLISHCAISSSLLCKGVIFLKFLPGVTTSGGTNWRAQIEAAIKLSVAEVALFPTTLGPSERTELYDFLDQTKGDLSVVAVHLRDDMEHWEYREFQRLGARVFNLHATPRALEFVQNNPVIAKTIFVENGYSLDEIYWQMLEICGGACIDLAHLEDFGFRQGNAGYDRLIAELPNINIGMTHIAAVRAELHETPCGNGVGTELTYEEHFVEIFPDELEYLWRPEILVVVRRCPCNCIELGNPIDQQLDFIRHIEDNILGQH
jgi:hypothetical protein